jgi:hypothetical protein
MGAHGTGYTSPPTVTLTGGGTLGGGGSAVAFLAGGAVTGLSLGTGGTGFNAAPTVVFIGGGGSGAAANAKLAVDLVVITNGGTGYTTGSGYALSFFGGGGSGAAGTFDVDLSGAITNVLITAPGSGYTSAPGVTFTAGGPGTGATWHVPMRVASLTLTAGGSLYHAPPRVAFNSLIGSGATATATVSPVTVGSVGVATTGALYTSAPTVTISGGGGSGATATAVIATITVGSVTLTSGGSGYTSAPAVVFSGGGGSGAGGSTQFASRCCFSGLIPDGTYTVTASKGGYTTASGTVTVTTPGPAGRTLTLFPPTQPLCITVLGCGTVPTGFAPAVALAGVTVDFTPSGGGTTVTVITDGSGVACLTTPLPTSYTVHISYPGQGYSAQTITGVSTDLCASTAFTFQLATDADHLCCFNFPIPRVLTLTDSNGAWTLTFQTSGLFAGLWTGQASGSTGSMAGCPSGPTGATGGVAGTVNYCYTLSCIIDTVAKTFNGMQVDLIFHAQPQEHADGPPPTCDWFYLNDGDPVCGRDALRVNCGNGPQVGITCQGVIPSSGVGTYPFTATGSAPPVLTSGPCANTPPSPAAGGITIM